MSVRELRFEEVREFCLRREVDLALVTPPEPFSLCWRAHYDGYNDFFFVVAADVECAEISSGFTVGDMRWLTSALAAFPPYADGKRLPQEGPALAIRSAYAGTWEETVPGDRVLLVAHQIKFLAGDDWFK